MTMRKTSQ